MVDMNEHDSNDRDFAYVHVRPGLAGKQPPIGTIAVRLKLDRLDDECAVHAVGFAVRHSKKEKVWDAARGRAVARGRAERSRRSLNVEAAGAGNRRALLTKAVEAVLRAGERGWLPMTKKARAALADTLARMTESADRATYRRMEEAASA